MLRKGSDAVFKFRSGFPSFLQPGQAFTLAPFVFIEKSLDIGTVETETDQRINSPTLGVVRPILAAHRSSILPR